MTNLSAAKNNRKSKYITPENALIFIPLCIGLLVTGLLIPTIFIPLRNRLSNERSQIEILESKISLIPIYMEYIKRISDSINKANNQQQRLIQLISDPNELKTLLSEINVISLKNSIEIIDIKAKQIEKSRISKNNLNTPNQTVQISKPDKTKYDPFLIPTIEKHTFIITLNGNYIDILNFLKELELFQAIAITDSIEISSIKSGKGQSTYQKAKNLKMKFELSTYSNVE